VTEAPFAPPEITGYEVTARLGAGGFGTVVRARRAGRDVAIKIAHGDPESRARLAREVEMLRALGPPHVPAFVEAGQLADGAPFVAMELVDAPALAAHMAALDGPIGGARLAELIAPIAATMTALHGRGVAHRDLKPENVLVRGDRAVVVDFGLARGGEQGRATVTGAAAGTAIYMAPEQVSDAAPGPASDVYALGVMLYELAAGRPPFFGSDAEVRVAHQAHRPPPPRELAAMPDALDALIRECVAKQPERRPTMRELAARLAGAIEGDRAAARQAAGAIRTRAACAVLWFEGPGANVARVAAAVAARRGELAGTERIGEANAAWVAVFSPLDGARPIERARRAGEELVAAGLADRAHVELRELVIRTRGDGSRQLITAVEPRSEALGRVDAGRVGAGRVDAASGSSSAGAREPIFVGRDALLGELVRRIGAALERRVSQRFTVVGADGMGCTRFGRRLASAAARIAWVDMGSLVGVNDGPRHLARELLELPRDAPADPLASARALTGATEEIELAAFAHAVGWPAPAAAIEMLRATPGAYRGALARALASAIVRAAAGEPLLVIVDDAHAAGATTLDAIRLATEARPVRLAVCLLSRRALWEREPTMELAPLAADEAGALCRDLLSPARDVPAAVVAQIVERSSGVPRAIVELVSSLRAAGAIRRRARGREWYLEAAALAELSPGQTVQREVAALDPALRLHAGAIALLPGASARDVEDIVERIDRAVLPLDPGAALERLRARGVLDRGEQLRFASAAVRDALAEALPPDLVRRIHAAAIAHHEALAAARPDDREHRARLAPHLAASGDVARAVAIVLELADAVRDGHDYLGAEVLYARALELGGADPAIELRARRGRAAMRYRQGRYEDSLVDFERARELARDAASDPALGAELALDEATALDWMGEYARSAARVDAARALVDACSPAAGEPPARLSIRLALAEGRSLFRRSGPSAEACARLEQVLAPSGALAGDTYEDRIAAMVLLVYLLPSLDRLDDAEAIAGAAIELCERRGDRQHLMAVLTNRQAVSMPRGLADRAIADLERAGQIGHELGMPIQRYRTALGLAEIHRRLGRHADARGHAECARAIEAESSAAGVQQTAAVMLVQILAALGDAGGARDLLAGIDRAALLDEDRLLVRGMALALAGGDDAGAWVTVLDDAARIVPEILPDLIEQRALAAERDGRLDDARRFLFEAERAARTHDPVAVFRIAARRGAS
jgi:eukaryotic-like serine/threonine-protein kinase